MADLKYAPRPSPARRGELAAEISDLEARGALLTSRQVEAERLLHAARDEAKRADAAATMDRARLLSLDLTAEQMGEPLPNPADEAERANLRDRLAQPARLVSSLSDGVARLKEEAKATAASIARATADLAAHDAQTAAFAEYDLGELRARAAANAVLSPRELEILAQAGR